MTTSGPRFSALVGGERSPVGSAASDDALTRQILQHEATRKAGLQPATIRLLQEVEHMTIKSKLVTLFAAGMLVSTVAAHAQGAMAPDPNIAPSTSGEAEKPQSGVGASSVSFSVFFHTSLPVAAS